MKIKFEIPVKVFKEGNTWIYYNKKYNISGYGETKKKAKGMFLFCIDDCLRWFPADNIKKKMKNANGK